MRRDFARSSDAALPGAGFRGAVDCSDAVMMFRVSSPATIALAPGAPGHKTDGMSRHRRKGLERATGIEPVSLAWKARVLPLHNARLRQTSRMTWIFAGQGPEAARVAPTALWRSGSTGRSGAVRNCASGPDVGRL